MLLAVDQANASVLALPDPPVAASVFPSQLLRVEVLRRPVESAEYTSIAFTTRLLDARVDASVGSVGDAYDNALAETTIGLYKTELIRCHGPWRTCDQIEIATLEYIDWYDHCRPIAPRPTYHQPSSKPSTIPTRPA